MNSGFSELVSDGWADTPTFRFFRALIVNEIEILLFDSLFIRFSPTKVSITQKTPMWLFLKFNALQDSSQEKNIFLIFQHCGGQKLSSKLHDVVARTKMIFLSKLRSKLCQKTAKFVDTRYGLLKGRFFKEQC